MIEDVCTSSSSSLIISIVRSIVALIRIRTASAAERALCALNGDGERPSASLALETQSSRGDSSVGRRDAAQTTDIENVERGKRA